MESPTNLSPSTVTTERTVMSLTRTLFTITLILGTCFGFCEKTSTSFESTIPVVDLNDFYNPATKQAFVDQVAKALHEVGFFAVINPNIELATLKLA
jgi:hypothetical protein